MQVALVMALFGIGAAVPLLLLGMLSREAMMKLRGRMMSAGRNGKLLLGAVLLTTGLLIVTGFDKRLEASLVEISPAWLTEMTTKF